MKTLATLLFVSVIGIMFAGCSASIEQYKPLYQIKPEKKPIKSGV